MNESSPPAFLNSFTIMQNIIHKIHRSLLTQAGTAICAALLLLFATACDQSSSSSSSLESLLLSSLVSANTDTVVDPVTGLEWKKCSQGQLYETTYKTCRGNATPNLDDGIYGAVTLQYCSSLTNDCNTVGYPMTLTTPGGTSTSEAYTSCANETTAGKTDWRVPTSLELQSILSTSRNAMLTTYPDTVNGLYWSNEASTSDFNLATVISFRIFDFGESSSQSKTIRYYLRCVRNY